MDETYEGVTSRLGRRIVAPLLALMALLVIACTLGFVSLAAREDAREAAEAEHLVGRLVVEMQAEIGRTLRDYAGWSETYLALHGHVDLDWALLRGNLGASLGDTYGITFVTVVAPDDRETLTVERDTLTFPLAARAGGALMPLVGRVRAGFDGKTVPLTAFGIMDGAPYLFAAAAITPAGDPSVVAAPGPPTVLAMARPITDSMLQTFGESFAVDDLHLNRGVRPEPGVSTRRIPAGDGTAAFTLAWTPYRPGSDLVATVRPWAAVVLLAIVAIVAFLIRRGLRTVDELDEANAALARAHRRAEFQAQHDETTGLPNRQLMTRFAAEQLGAARALGLLFIDLDRFKPINDAFGHEVGDRVLRAVAGRLVAALPPDGLAARCGGDEFAVAIADATEASLAGFADRLIQSVARPIQVGMTQSVTVGLSIGIAVAPGHSGSFEDLMRHADVALYAAKRAGRGVYRFFTASMSAAVERRKALEEDLRAAIARDELALHYQPRVTADDLRIVGAEALLRWRHPVHGLVSPAEFISIAEETGQIVDIGAWVLERAAEAAVGLPGLKISVNVSAVQVRCDRLVTLVSDVLARTGLEPSQLELELTESTLVEDRDTATEVVGALRRLGVSIAIDDFGSGYSSLNYLRHFPFDTIKLDRGFIADLDATPEVRAIVRAVVELGRGLGLTVVAEGVETWEQLMLLRLERCHQVQGYLTGVPMPLADFAAAVAAGTREVGGWQAPAPATAAVAV